MTLTPRESKDTAHSSAAPTRDRWVFLGFLGLAAFLLIVEHRAHLFGFLPWLILLACPLMHLFMHRGHGHGGHGGHRHGAPDRDVKGGDK